MKLIFVKKASNLFVQICEHPRFQMACTVAANQNVKDSIQRKYLLIPCSTRTHNFFSTKFGYSEFSYYSFHGSCIVLHADRFTHFSIMKNLMLNDLK